MAIVEFLIKFFTFLSTEALDFYNFGANIFFSNGKSSVGIEIWTPLLESMYCQTVPIVLKL